jgi:hypothetical protein
MKFSLLVKAVAVASLTAIATGQAAGCKCGAKFHGKNNWELAKLEANDTTVIFEGIPERLELQWEVMQAEEGARISAFNLGAKPNCGPMMLVTFRVQRAYKGALGPTIQIKTGLGGGDCGAVFDPGLTYLIFAYGTSLSDLNVNMCSPGGWIAGGNVATELRYLRKEQPIARDLLISQSWTPAAYAALDAQRRRDAEEFRNRYAAATGKICGKVLAEKTSDGNTGILSFLSTVGYSPVQHPTANINPDGSFCSGFLGPGKYYLYFTRGSVEGPMSAIYYPGVGEQNKATKVEVMAGRTESNITFKIPVQKAYSVRGVISTNDKSGLDARSVSVSLIGLDGTPYLFAYNQPIDFRGSLPLPKVKYFEIENVLPGRYIAYVTVLGKGWYTKKEEVDVTTHMKFISLQLEHIN